MLLASLACRNPERDLPEHYRNMNVPEARLASPAARARGRNLYQEHCALCHGERGDGHGERRSALDRSPANFTNRAWRRGTTPRRVFFVIREGERGTPMPAWKALSKDETWDLVAYVLSISEP
jgi:mono/diheme cytochrome c family protein